MPTSDRAPDDPPDWALPSWDALTPAAGSGSGPRSPRQPRAADPGPAVGLRVYSVSEVTRSI
ncbi:MAG TPA: hypothetical protein VGK63_01260, partial [Candidatus Limnocylindrales bacterium]